LDTGTRLSVEWVAIGGLYCPPANPRKNEEAIPHVAASLRRFGWQQPIVERNHQGLDNGLIEPPRAADGEIVCDQRLGGLLKFSRRAA
jgi:hypothetical protein